MTGHHTDDDYAAKTDAQKEWADWSAHGYRKRYQPRPVLWFGGVFVALLIVALMTVFWLTASGRFP